ncbi:TetR/AcrR family transcriptional regulator [Agromyces sp. LHK192]|uniref:TetR/AcrR family transcriptional regulator n=1 Tax=Agromyces sp. LHK192 TaxID=2498704 RepID=UPI000FD77AFE|nr:TetR/AcrR family transcriptional regulator C-terminal domain-containing protein [Agromyces sp. LHK192]
MASDDPGTVQLLWRHELPTPPKLGRPRKITLDAVIEAGVRIADELGTPDFALRAVADALEVGTMTLYSYVSTKEQLLELMVDRCRETMAFTPGETGGDRAWRESLALVAADNLALLARHPWMAHLESERAVLGPGTLAKYERELQAVESLRLDDPGKDAALALVLDFVRASARALAAASVERAVETPEQWWAREGELLAALGVEARFPLASRIGAAAGATANAAHDARRAYEFGLAVILDGIERQQEAG